MNNDLISRSELKEKVNAFYDKLFVGCVSSDLITYASGVDEIIDTAPTIKPERPHGEWIVKVERRGFYAGDKTVYSYTCPFCGKKEFDAYEFCRCGADMRPEKKIQTPSCLTNPERQAELLERYKEE